MSRTNVLVDADWVQRHTGNPAVVLVEVDEDVSAYATGHIRGAVPMDWTTQLQAPQERDVLGKEDFEKLLSGQGIGNDDTVVLYGGNNNWFAAYAYWSPSCTATTRSSCSTVAARSGKLDGRELVGDVPTRPATRYVAKQQDLLSGPSAMRCLPPAETRTSSMSAAPTSSAGRSKLPHTYRRSKANAPATSRVPSTFPGARP